MPIKVALHGAGGRMGQRLLSLISADAELVLVQAIEYAEHPLQGKPVSTLVPDADSGIAFSTELVAGADVVIDFSLPAGALVNTRRAAELGIPIIAGTTAKDFVWQDDMAKASEKVAMIHAGNYSLGVNLINRLAREAAKALGSEYNVEIVEAHHNLKIDAPSGTAMGLAGSVAKALNLDVEKDLLYGREGETGKRPADKIGMHSLRMGSVIGDHTVHFGNAVERIEITHRAESRDAFAAGALRAAKWIVGKAPGMYSVDDVLFG